METYFKINFACKYNVKILRFMENLAHVTSATLNNIILVRIENE